MPQTLDFPLSEESTLSFSVEIEPGDATRYKFILTNTTHRHDWGEQDGELIGVASMTGPIFPGIWFPLARARDWWKETMWQIPVDSLSHHFIEWIIGETSEKAKVNPWTVRAALLAVIRVYGE
jgi:hypothetical protein